MLMEYCREEFPQASHLIKKAVSLHWDTLAISQQNALPLSTVPHQLINLSIDFFLLLILIFSWYFFRPWALGMVASFVEF